MNPILTIFLLFLSLVSSHKLSFLSLDTPNSSFIEKLESLLGNSAPIFSKTNRDRDIYRSEGIYLFKILNKNNEFFPKVNYFSIEIFL